jgi:7,8-dihydropterin-6-yl-methyl-4-(beta-D-ribofuranosyl)aminobenzene 5'-phosphate synthase
MKLTIVYDNEICKKDAGLKSDWGFSCLIETENENILFDTGAKGKILLNNMEKLDVYPEKINKIVISHEHWDHYGGLKALVPLVGNIELYRLGKESPSGNMNLITVKEPREIIDGVYTTGRLTGTPVDEQSLVLKGKKDWYVLTGCSHSGVKEILNASREYRNVAGPIGGLHDFNNFHILGALELVCAIHCTKHKKEIQRSYPEISVEGGVGRIIEI